MLAYFSEMKPWFGTILDWICQDYQDVISLYTHDMLSFLSPWPFNGGQNIERGVLDQGIGQMGGNSNGRSH